MPEFTAILPLLEAAGNYSEDGFATTVQKLIERFQQIMGYDLASLLPIARRFRRERMKVSWCSGSVDVYGIQLSHDKHLQCP